MIPDDVQPYAPDSLPPAVQRYLGAPAGDRAVVADAFRPDAVVTDDGHTYEGIAAVRGWLGRAGSEYTYTTTFTGQRRDDAEHWTVLVRLEGDFPGGVAVLRYVVELRDGLIATLLIAP